MKASEPQQVFGCFWGSGANSPVPKAVLQGVSTAEAIAPNHPRERLIPEHPHDTNAAPGPQNTPGKPLDSTISPRDREELFT